MNKDLSELVLGLVIMVLVYLFVAFASWELDISEWHWVSRCMFLLMSIGGYMSVDIIWEEEEEE